MKANTQFNIGKAGQGYGVSLSAEITTADVETVLGFGLKWLAQRVTEVDDILGGYRVNAKGKRERVPGYKRSDCAYGTATAEKFKTLFASLAFPDSTDEVPHTLATAVSIGLAEGTAAEPVFARERKKFEEKESTPAGLAAWLKAFAGYEGETHGEDGEYSREALQAAKVAIDAYLASV